MKNNLIVKRIVMKSFAILLITMLTGSILLAHETEGQGLDNVMVSLQLENTRVKKVLEELQERTEFNFLYNEKDIRSLDKISVQASSGNLEEVLYEISRQTGLSFRRVNENIAVRLKEKQEGVVENAKTLFDKKITGKVTDAETGKPLIGATVQVKGTTIGTVTDVDGNFVLNVPENSESLRVSYIGYKTIEMVIDNRLIFNISLKIDATQLDEAVVTALGISREEKSLGYSVQELESREITNVNSNNWINSLNGKIAGLYLTKSTSLASSTRVVFRGESSLNLDKNQALFVVDGVPITNIMTPSEGKGAYSREPDFGNGISEINPNDIESISILKGPSASALYGSRAANGVIMITTKSGKQQQGFGISLNSNVLFESVNRWPDYQYEYGAGGVGKHEYYSFGDSEIGPTTANSGYNWGPKFEGQEYVQFGSPLDENGNRIPIPWEAHPDNIKGFFRTGSTLLNTVALSTGNETGHLRLSYTNMNKQGIVPNNALSRNNIAFNAGTLINDKLKINAVANYINSGADNITYSGYAGAKGIMYHFIWQERNLDIDWLKDYWVKGKEGIEQNKVFSWASNPYFVVNEVLNGFNKDRIFGNVNTTYSVNDHFDIMLRAGTDLFNENRTFRAPFSTNGYPYGYFRTLQIYSTETNIDFLLSYDTQIFNNFKVELSLGGNRMQQEYQMQEAFAQELAIPEVYSLGNSRSRPKSSESAYEKVVNSFYGFGQLSYRDMLFLDITGRNDWSSTLPVDNNSFFYPSVNLSAIASEMLDLSNTPISFAKIRLSLAQVGNDTDPYQLQKYYNYNDLGGSVTNPSTLPNAELKPEITTNYELGTNIRLFNNRLDFDLTLYKTDSKNQILNVPVDISSGFSSRIMNAGLIINKGIEILIKTSILNNLNGINWSLFGNWSANRNEVVKLGEGVDTYLIATAPGANVEARVGESFGNIYGKKFLRAPDGQIVYKDGVPQWTEDFHLVGNYNPDWVAGFGSEFSYKGLSFSFLFDGRMGGKVFSLSHATMSASGGLKKTLPYRYDGVVGDGVMLDDNGEYVPNNVKIDAPTYWRGMYRRYNAETNTLDASFLKLREMRLEYALPTKWLNSIFIQKASIALVGRDLFIWSDWPIFDPEASDIDGGTITPGIERAQFPSTRSYGLNVNLNF